MVNQFKQYIVNPFIESFQWCKDEFYRLSNYLWEFVEWVHDELENLYVYADGKLRWVGNYQDGTFLKNDVTLDDGYLMVANKATTDRPAPQWLGVDAYVYDGASPTDSVSAKQIIQGIRYLTPYDIFVTGYRVYTIAGNAYRTFLIGTSGQIEELTAFEASTTGWTEFDSVDKLVLEGTSFDLLVVTSEPDATPTTWVGNWVYQTPQNAAIPAVGNIIHATKLLDSFRINKTDDDAGDRGTELEALTVGDIIDGAGIRWAIQGIVDNVTWMDFTVSPAQQGATGTHEFSFETVTATPITYLEDVDYWLGNANVRGLFGADIAYDDIVPDDNQYGIDMKIVQTDMSPDWDLMAHTDSIAAPDSSVEAYGINLVLLGDWTSGTYTTGNVVRSTGQTWVALRTTTETPHPAAVDWMDL